MRYSLRSIEADSAVCNRPLPWAAIQLHIFHIIIVLFHRKEENFIMDTYMELSSLVKRLRISEKALYSASNCIHRHYHSVKIPKSNGECRQLFVPDDFLKMIQRRIAERLLSQEEISPYATAYREGGSTVENAMPHIGQPVMLKLDIRHFFDHLIYPMVKEKAFPAKKYSEANRILLSLLCVYMDALPQGAPTSPMISNIIMKDFDNLVGNWCQQKGIAYTRYCDDMTFSGDFVPGELITYVKLELRKMGLLLNTKKTVIVKKGQKHLVTGIVVNEKISVPKEYKKKIRQEMYYCMKYGIESHAKRKQNEETEGNYLYKLLGQINYVISVEP